MEYITFIFDTLTEMVTSVETGSKALSASIISTLKTAQVLQILFAIQFSIMVFRFVLDRDGFVFLTGFIRNVAVYIIVLSALNNWSTLGFGFVTFFDSVVTTSMSSAASALSGKEISGSNATGLLTSMKTAFDGEFDRIDAKFDEYRKDFERKINEKKDEEDKKEGEGGTSEASAPGGT